MVRVQHHLDLRAGNRFEQFERIVERGKECPLLGTAGVHGLDGQRDAQRAGLRGQLGQCPLDQSPGMVVGVAGAGTAADDQRAAVQLGGGPHGFRRVVDALAVAAAVAAGESAGPKQVRDLQPAAAEQLAGLRQAAVGEFLPPDADGGNARGRILRHVLFERPAEGGRFVHREFRHPCPLRRE